MLPKLFKTLPIILGVLVAGLFMPATVLAGNPPVQSNSQYTNPSNSIPDDGSTTGTITIHLQDSNNAAVVGDVISLSSPNDSTATFPQNNQTTDGSGNATFTIASTTAGTDEINLYDGNGPTTFSNWFTVTFYDTSKGCQNSPAAPTLSSVTSNSNNTATLTWTDSPDPVSNYLVSYGVATGNYIYGDPNIGGQGTTSFTVGALAGGKKYYFAVAATNNCGRSGFSNEVAAVVDPIPSTPAPTLEPTTEPTSSDVSSSVVEDSPTDTPQPTDTPTPAPAAQDTNTTFRNLGIGVVAAGILIIGIVFIVQKTNKKSRIPPMRNNPPQPFNPPMGTGIPQQPPIQMPQSGGGNIPQQPY